MQDQPQDLVGLGPEAAGESGDGSTIELAAEVLQSFGRLRVRVTGSSMLPAIRPGDVLLVRRCSVAAAGVGDVVLFTRRSRLFAHRVVSRDGETLLTRGDAVDGPDAPIGARELLGKVDGLLRAGRSSPESPRATLVRRFAAGLVRRSPLAATLLTRMYGVGRRTCP